LRRLWERRRVASEMISRHRVAAQSARRSAFGPSTERPAAKSSARRMLPQMSVNESRARLESIKRVALDISPHERLKAAAVGYFDAARKEVREILCNPNVFEEADRRLWVQLDQNIDIAGALALTTRDGAEQRRVTNTVSVQLRLVSPRRAMIRSRSMRVCRLASRRSFFIVVDLRPPRARSRRSTASVMPGSNGHENSLLGGVLCRCFLGLGPNGARKRRRLFRCFCSLRPGRIR
jgi:hypothetical protein